MLDVGSTVIYLSTNEAFNRDGRHRPCSHLVHQCSPCHQRPSICRQPVVAASGDDVGFVVVVAVDGDAALVADDVVASPVDGRHREDREHRL